MEYKLVISLFQYRLDFDNSIKKEPFKVIDPSVKIGLTDMLKGNKFINSRFSLELIKRERTLERIDTSNIARIIVCFNN